MTELASCLASELGPLSLNDFAALLKALRATGSPKEASRCFVERSRLREVLESGEAWQRARDLKALCDNENLLILFPGHAQYPAAFYDLPQPPLFLTVQGEFSALPMFSIVGSREPTRLAVDWMREHLPLFHQQREVTVVSGGARGVDQLAHFSAIEASRPTVLFSPSGLLRLYPRDLGSWRDIITAGGGALVSEFHPHAVMQKRYFLRRNRLIAALSKVTFVVEARRKSGSLLTAKTALELHRDLCVLPGSPLNHSSQGTTDLMFDGAQPIRDVHDLVQFWDISHGGLSPASAQSENRRDQKDPIGEPDSGDNGKDHVFR